MHYHSQSTFTHRIWFHLHSISPHNAGIPQGSVHSSSALSTFHSLPGIYHPHLRFWPPSMWWWWPNLYSQLSVHTGDVEGHTSCELKNSQGLSLGNHSQHMETDFLLQISSLFKHLRVTNNTMIYQLTKLEIVKSWLLLL